MTRPIQAHIDLSALRHNYLVATKHASLSGKTAKAWAVIKADAYGHGMLRTARALQSADGFAVLRVEEGIALREAGHGQVIALLEGFFSEDELLLLALKLDLLLPLGVLEGPPEVVAGRGQGAGRKHHHGGHQAEADLTCDS